MAADHWWYEGRRRLVAQLLAGRIRPDAGAIDGGGGTPETLPKVDSAAQCPPGANAWYYDNNANPTQIILCPDTCSNLSAGENGEVNVVLGCDTVVQ